VGVDLGAMLSESGAILNGHFVLSSGRHSSVYIEKFRVIERPDVLSALCSEIAAEVRANKPDFVAGPLTGGIIIAFEVARQLGVPARYIESEAGAKTFRRQTSIPLGSRFLIVDDVLTTGLSLRESAEAVRQAGGKVESYAVLIDRSEALSLDRHYYAAYKVDATSYAEDEVPDWLAAIPVTKPGTRTLR
jgi:orotate phosphoribosyltransferase